MRLCAWYLLLLGLALGGPACLRSGFPHHAGDAGRADTHVVLDAALDGAPPDCPGDAPGAGADVAAPDSGGDLAPDSGGDLAPDSGPDGTPPAPGTPLWSHRLGQAGGVERMVLATDGSGDVYLAGDFRGAVNLGGADLTSIGDTDLFLASFTADGAHRWSRALGGGDLDSVSAIAVAADGAIAITGRFDGSTDLGGDALSSAGNADGFVARFSGDGAHLWSRAFGSSAYEWGEGVAVDAAGNTFVTGRIGGTVDFGGGAVTSAGSWDIFVASFDADGAHRWSRAFGGASADAGAAVAVSPGGHVFASGYFTSTVDFGGGLLTSAGSRDVFVASFDGQDGGHRWSKAFGAAGIDDGHGLAVDASGNAFVVGVFEASVDFGGGALTSAGGTDAFVASFADDGAHRWSKAFGGASADHGNSVAVDAGGALVATGAFQGLANFGGGALTSAGESDVFIARLANDGSHLWSGRFGDGPVDEGHSVAVAPAGEVFFSGSFSGTIDLGGGALSRVGNTDIFVASLDAAGAHRWSRSYGGTGRGEGGTIAAGAGRIAIAGRFGGAVDLGGGTLSSAGFRDCFIAGLAPPGTHRWSRAIVGDDDNQVRGIAIDPAGRSFATGSFRETVDLGGGPLTSAAFEDIFLASYADDGAHRWSRRLGGSGSERGVSIVVDASHRLFVTGRFYGTADLGGGPLTSAGQNDIFLASFTADGDHLWSKRLGGSSSDEGRAVALDPSGNVVVAGFFADTINLGGDDLTSSLGDDLFVASFTPDGAHRWSRGFAASGFVEDVGLAVDASGRVFVCGSYYGTADLGGGALVSAGYHDIVLAGLDAAGVHRWSHRFGSDRGDNCRALAVDASGELFLTGSFEETVDFGGGALTSAGGADVFVASFTGDGAHRWSVAAGSVGDDEGRGLVLAAGAVLVTGHFYDRLDFGGGALPGARAVFVAAFTP